MLHRHANSPPTAPYMARKMSVCGSAGRYVLGSWAAIGRTGPCRGVVGLPETTPRVTLSGKSIWEIGPPCREFCGQNAHEKWGGGPVGQFWGYGRQSGRRPLAKGPLGPPNPPSPHSQLQAWSGKREPESHGQTSPAASGSQLEPAHIHMAVPFVSFTRTSYTNPTHAYHGD